MSLISTYNSIKSLLVTKLTNKGINNASTSQGMTTLINKIDDIETTIPTTLTADFSGTYPPNVDVPFDVMLKSNFTNDDNVSINAPLAGADIDFYIDDTLDDTITTNNNGLSSYVLNISEKDTYTIKAKFEESVPFAGAIISGTITIFESIIKVFRNITFTHSSGEDSMEVSYSNNESLTMTVQSFEQDYVTASKGSQVDFLIINSDGYETSTLQQSVEYDFTGYDLDVELNRSGYAAQNIIQIGQYLIQYNAADGYYIGDHDDIESLSIIDNTLYLVWYNGNKYSLGTINNLTLTPYVSGIQVKKYNENFSIVDTVINDSNGFSSYTYEAEGTGEYYIRAQSHDNLTVCTRNYLISDWVKKDFMGVGNWIAFSGRVNTFSSNTDTVFTQGNGSKGGVHSQNTIFHLPNDDYTVSFKINNGTIGVGVRVGLHSATYNDHHEKAVIGIENDSSGGFKFDYSTSEVTTVTKVITGVTKLNTDDLIEFKVINDTVSFYINGTSYGSATLNWLHTPIWLYAQSWSTNNGNFSIKDFRVKRIINND